MDKRVRKLYKTSIFVTNYEEVMNDYNYFNRYDEFVISQLAVGTLSHALSVTPEIKLTANELTDLVCTMVYLLNEMPLVEIIEESKKYDLSV